VAVNKKLRKQDLGKLLGEWAQNYAILVPSRENGVSGMAAWDGKDVSFLDWYRNTVRPVKDVFLPAVEAMFRFHRDQDGYHLEPSAPDGQKKLIFGIRPCDASALSLLDRVFSEGYPDPYYLERRRNTLLVGLVCTEPYDSCFCTSVGGGPSDARNVDVLLTDLGKEFFVEAITEAGQELVASSSSLQQTTQAEEDQAKQVKESAQEKLSRHVNVDAVKDRLLSHFEDQDLWEQVSRKCLSCAVCTFLCPTCHCFDISEERTGKQGTRYRSWDSCAFPMYTRMPMENPRSEKWKRVRQRISHKFEYFPINFGVLGCVGCGRCVRQCPVNLDICATLEQLPAPK
jgi:hypothetical protein